MDIKFTVDISGGLYISEGHGGRTKPGLHPTSGPTKPRFFLGCGDAVDRSKSCTSWSVFYISSISVLFRFVWLEIEGTGLDGFCSICQGHLVFQKDTYGFVHPHRCGMLSIHSARPRGMGAKDICTWCTVALPYPPPPPPPHQKNRSPPLMFLRSWSCGVVLVGHCLIYSWVWFRG